MKRGFQSVVAALSGIAILILWPGGALRPAAGRPPTKQASVPPPLTIAQPPTNTVSGTCRLAVSSNLKSITSIEYRLGSRRLGIATRPPFELDWNTAYAADGSSALQAIARDGFGNPIAAAERIFAITNSGNFIDTTSALPKVLSGIVTLHISGQDHRYYPAQWLAYIDGEMLATGWTDNLGKHAASVTMRVDTTRFANGRHELYVAMHSDFWPPGRQARKSFYSWRGAFERVVEIDNGHSLMDIAANYLHVYLRPAERTVLTCRQLFTDGATGPCSAPRYSTDNPQGVSIAAGGEITAGPRPGFATITLTDRGRTTAARVWVRRRSGIPHFAGNGAMLTAYRAGASMFVVAPFALQPGDLSTSPDLTAAVRRAGVNTLSRGFYQNPRNLRADYRVWRQSLYNNAEPDWRFARDHGFHIFATGDEVARGIGGEAWWTLNWPFGKYAVQYAMSLLAASGAAIAVDMVDEASMMWGATPRPPGKVGAPGSFTSIACSGMTCTVSWPHNPVTPKRFPSGLSFALDHSLNGNLNTPPGAMFTATNSRPDSFEFTPAGPLRGRFTAANDPDLEFVWWAGNIGGCPAHPCIPPVPDSALTGISAWIKTAPASVPISWPVLGIAPAVVQGNWMGRGAISDYASHYWDSFNLRRTYPWSGGIQEFTYWMRELFYGRQALMMLDRPQMFLASISSFMYVKRTRTAAYYTPPADELLTPGYTGPATTATIMSAAALGGAGVRLYQFEPPRSLAARIKARPGTTLQTGANPTAADPMVRENWRAMAFAANPLTKTLVPYILGAPLASPACGRNIVTAARTGPGARMLMVLNGNDWPRIVAVDFRPYRTGRPISRYRIGYDGIATDAVADGPGQRIELAAGESVVYLFPAGAGRFAPTVRIASPGGRKRAILHYGYIYQEALSEALTGIECTRGCALELDRALGPVYYQFTYLDSTGAVTARSPVVMLAPAPG